MAVAQAWCARCGGANDRYPEKTLCTVCYRYGANRAENQQIRREAAEFFRSAEWRLVYGEKYGYHDTLDG